MNEKQKKTVRRSGILLILTALLAAGIHTAVLRSEAGIPASVSRITDEPPVIVLDAGHGEST